MREKVSELIIDMQYVSPHPSYVTLLLLLVLKGTQTRLQNAQGCSESSDLFELISTQRLHMNQESSDILWYHFFVHHHFRKLWLHEEER